MLKIQRNTVSYINYEQVLFGKITPKEVPDTKMLLQRSSIVLLIWIYCTRYEGIPPVQGKFSCNLASAQKALTLKRSVTKLL